MSASAKAETVRRLFTAFLSKDRPTAEAILSDDFTFTSPYDNAIDKAEYFERCWANSAHIKSQTVEKLFVEGDEAFVLYHIVTVDGKHFRNAEFFTFSGEQIRSVNVFFGATYKDGAFISASPE
jgi:ketosteroid isomerase-like protein